MSSNIDVFLQLLSECPPGPHSDIDETLTKELKGLVNKSLQEQIEGLKGILDKAAYYGLASDFGMVVMHSAWEYGKQLEIEENKGT